MTKKLFLEDSYLKECDATVQSVTDGRCEVLDRTIFYAKCGGQPNDTGKIIKGDKVYKVVYAGTFSCEISHEVDPVGLQVGDKVNCILNWERRYKLMRSHTAAHVIASLLNQGTGALITGNQLEEIMYDLILVLKNSTGTFSNCTLPNPTSYSSQISLQNGTSCQKKKY
jgi:misacylated tRNA(Ala) deacylase